MTITLQKPYDEQRYTRFCGIFTSAARHFCIGKPIHSERNNRVKSIRPAVGMGTRLGRTEKSIKKARE